MPCIKYFIQKFQHVISWKLIEVLFRPLIINIILYYIKVYEAFDLIKIYLLKFYEIFIILYETIYILTLKIISKYL